VTGTDGDVTNEGLQQNYIMLLSSEVSGNAFAGAIASPVRVTPFNASGRNGAGADLNGDGVGDWGSNSSDIADTGYMLARSGGPTAAGGTAGVAVAGDPNSWDFRVARWTLNVTSLGLGGDTRIGIVKPTANFAGPNAYALYHDDAPKTDADGDPDTPDVLVNESQSHVDTTNYQTSGINGTSTYGDFVTLSVVPEPSNFALLSLTGAGALARRRR
jgi:hypothetical protein